MSAPLTLAALEQAFMVLDQTLAVAEETGDDVEEIARVWFEKLVGDLEVKAAAAVRFCHLQERLAKGLDAMAKEAAAEAGRFRAGAKVRRNRAERLEQLLMRVMHAAQAKRIETAVGTVCIEKDGGRVALEVDEVDLDAVAELHPDLVVFVPTLNNDAVRDALVAGRVLPFARLREQGEHIKVR